MTRALLAVSLTAAPAALGGLIGFALGVGVGLVILTAREPRRASSVTPFSRLSRSG